MSNEKKYANNVIRCGRLKCQEPNPCGDIPPHFGITKRTEKIPNRCMKLDDLYDTNVGKVQDGQYLCYTGGKWIPCDGITGPQGVTGAQGFQGVT